MSLIFFPDLPKARITQELISDSDDRLFAILNIYLSSKPLVVATVTQPDDLALVKTQATPVSDILEYRLDDLVDLEAEVLSILNECQTPSLITVRRPDEGGANELSDETRLELYRNSLSLAELIDVEVASLQSASFQSLCQETTVIGSFHDFEKFPGIDAINSKVEKAYELGAQVAKVAVVLESMDDLFALAKTVEHHRDEGCLISAMGMGRLGRLSRLVLAQAGSCLNYGYLRVANAPGQWSAKELSDLIAKLT